MEAGGLNVLSSFAMIVHRLHICATASHLGNNLESFCLFKVKRNPWNPNGSKGFFGSLFLKVSGGFTRFCLLLKARADQGIAASGFLKTATGYSHSTVKSCTGVRPGALPCAAVAEKPGKYQKILYSKLTHGFSLF